jgi:O-antigen/teichoic acid export membrane protein
MLLICILGFFVIRKKVAAAENVYNGCGSAGENFSIMQHKSSCLMLMSLSFSPLIFNEVATVVLAIFSSADEVADFNIAVPISMAFRTIHCIPLVFVPFAGDMIVSGNYAGVKKSLILSLAATIGTCVLMIPFFIFFGDLCITLLFGRQFISALMPTAILSIAVMAAFAGQMNINTLNTLKKEKYSAILTAVTALIAVLIYSPMSYFFGASGVAAGALAAALIWSLLSFAVVMHQLNRKEKGVE